MLIVGVILLVLGVLLGIGILQLLGLLLAIIGAVLLVASYSGEGRRRYW